MAASLGEVKAGDLITAKFMNTLLSDMADLRDRVGKLEEGVTGGPGGEPAIGFIDVSYKGGECGTYIDPNASQPFPQSFGIINSTNKTLQLQLSAAIVASHGNWAGSAVFKDGSSTTTVTILEQDQRKIDVLVKAPQDSSFGDTAILTVKADAGPPDNKHGETSTELKVGKQGPAVTHTLSLEKIVFPRDFTPTEGLPAGIDGRVPKGKERVISYIYKFDTLNTTEDPRFEFSVKLDRESPADALAAWSLLIHGEVPDEDTTDPVNGVRTLTLSTNLNFENGVAKNINLNLIAPNFDTNVRLSVELHSTNFAEVLKKAAPSIVIQSK